MPAKPSTSAPTPYSAASLTVSRLLHAMNSGGCGICTGRGRIGCGAIVELAVPRELVVEPHAADHAQRLFDFEVGALGIDAAQRHLLQRRPPAGAEVEAPAGERVEHRGPLGHAHRMVVVERHAAPRRARRGSWYVRAATQRQEDLGRAHVRVPLQRVVLGRPDAVEAHLLGEHRLVDTVEQQPLLARATDRRAELRSRWRSPFSSSVPEDEAAAAAGDHDGLGAAGAGWRRCRGSGARPRGCCSRRGCRPRRASRRAVFTGSVPSRSMLPSTMKSRASPGPQNPSASSWRNTTGLKFS